MEDPYKSEENVYKNSFNLKDYEDIKFAEEFWVELKMIDLLSSDLNQISYDSFLDIHKFLFEGFYEWAGNESSIQIKRNDDISYTNISCLRENGEKIIEKFNRIESNANSDIVARVISNTITDMWKNHTFRNGNLITVLAFVKMAAKKKGIKLNLSKLKTNHNLREAVKLSAKGKTRQLNLMVKQAMELGRGLER